MLPYDEEAATWLRLAAKLDVRYWPMFIFSDQLTIGLRSIVVSILAQARSDDETQRLQNLSEPHRKEAAALLQKSISIGEFRTNLHIARPIDAAVGAVYLRLLFGQSLDSD